MHPAKLQVSGLVVLVACMTAALVHATGFSEEISFLRHEADAAWISSGGAPTTGVVSAPFDALHEVEFVKRFRVDAAAPLRLELEALRGFELALNGSVRARRRWDEASWRSPVLLEAEAATGENELRVRVHNPSGPPLLRLRGALGTRLLVTDASWSASLDGAPPRSARRADDTLRGGLALGVPPLWRGLAARRDALIAVFLLGCAASALGRRGVARLGPRAPWLLLAAVVLLWGAVGAKAIQLPPYFGFDGPDHLGYVHQVKSERALPLADAGPQTYHPPLFYVSSALLLAALPTVPERIVLRAIPFAAGLAQILLAWLLARRLFPGDRLRAGAAGVVAAFLPVNLYMSAYLTNEPLHGALAAAALLGTTGLLLGERSRPAPLLAVGAILGLAVLSKVSSLLLLPVVLAFLAVKQRLAEGASFARLALHGAAVSAAFGVVAGWFFLRNQLLLGRALIGNWDVPGSPVAWWQPPGFHTANYYLDFGQALRRPFFASYESFWDGLYATFWGDGLLGGVASWAARHPLWDYEWMAAGYALALPATALLLVGFAWLAVDSFRAPQLRRRLALAFLTTCVFVTVFAALYMTLVLPAYSMTKASYLLSVTGPLALALAEGFVRLHRFLAVASRRWLQVVLHGWVATLLAAIVFAFAV